MTKDLIRLKQSSDFEKINLCNARMQTIKDQFKQKKSKYESVKKALDVEYYSIIMDLSQNLIGELQNECQKIYQDT